MRSLMVLEDWATSRNMAQRAIPWLLFWPLFARDAVSRFIQRGVSDNLRDFSRARAEPVRR
jgi:hypothetical protein